jgi:hypothetical protein
MPTDCGQAMARQAKERKHERESFIKSVNNLSMDTTQVNCDKTFDGLRTINKVSMINYWFS